MHGFSFLGHAVSCPYNQLKLRRNEHYAKLTSVRERGEYAKWVEFFCECLPKSAEDAIGAMGLLVGLHDRQGGLGKQPGKEDVFAWTASVAGAPIIDSAKVSMELKVEDIYEMDVFENFMCSALNTYAEESVLNENDTVDYTVFKPVLFEMPGYAYLATGDKIADCLKL